MSRPRVVAAYVSSHGYGHAVRTGEVLRAMLAASEDLAIEVRASAPRFLFPEHPRLRVTELTCDAGMVQSTSFAVDLDRTLAALDDLEGRADAWVDREVRALEDAAVEAVIADVPPLAFAAAARAGIPRFAVANFSWDWIYAHYAASDARFAAHAERAAERYALASALLRLPLHAPMPSFVRVVDVPLVSPVLPRDREAARRRLDLPSGRPIVVLSFSGPGLRGFDLAALAAIPAVFVATETLREAPGNVIVRPASAIDYSTLLAAADAVVTKPGYGIVSTCLANGLRVLCASRREFPEAEILERALVTLGTAEVVDPDVLASGRFGAELASLLARPTRPPAFAATGAARIAEIVLSGEHP